MDFGKTQYYAYVLYLIDLVPKYVRTGTPSNEFNKICDQYYASCHRWNTKIHTTTITGLQTIARFPTRNKSPTVAYQTRRPNQSMSAEYLYFNSFLHYFKTNPTQTLKHKNIRNQSFLLMPRIQVIILSFKIIKPSDRCPSDPKETSPTFHIFSVPVALPSSVPLWYSSHFPCQARPP